MSRVVIQALALMGVYLLVMTSAKPADAIVGLLLGLVLAVALRPRLPGRRPATPPLTGLLALFPVVAQTALEMLIGSWRTVRFCLFSTGRPVPASGRISTLVAAPAIGRVVTTRASCSSLWKTAPSTRPQHTH